MIFKKLSLRLYNFKFYH